MILCRHHVELGNNGRDTFGRCSPLIPVIQRNVKISCIRTGSACICHDILDVWNRLRFSRHGIDCLDCLIEGRPFRHLDACHEESLIFRRNKGRRKNLVESTHEDAYDDEENACKLQMMNHPVNLLCIAFAYMVERRIELMEECGKRAMPGTCIARLQEKPAEGRRQRQCNKCGNCNRYRNRHGKLLVKDARDAAKEGNRNEDGCQDCRRCDNRPLYFIHSRFRRSLWIEFLPFHVLFNVFNDDNRIIDDHADCQDHRKECQRIDGEIKKNERSKRTDNGNRHCEDRDQRRPPLLQEEEYDENDKNQRFNECSLDFIYGCIDERRIIHDDNVNKIRRETVLGLRKNLLDLRDSIKSIRIIGQLYAKPDPRLPVDLRIIAFILRASFNRGNILQMDKLAIGSRLQDDIPELFRCRETPFHLGTVLLFLRSRCRLGTDRTGRSGHVLLLDGRCDVCHRQPSFSELVRIQPDSHGIAGTECIDIAYAVYTLQFIQKVNICVILKEGLVICTLWRIQIDHQHHIAGCFPDSKDRLLDLGRQAVLGQIGTVLYIDGIRIPVRIEVKDNREAVRTAVA